MRGRSDKSWFSRRARSDLWLPRADDWRRSVIHILWPLGRRVEGPHFGRRVVCAGGDLEHVCLAPVYGARLAAAMARELEERREGAVVRRLLQVPDVCLGVGGAAEDEVSVRREAGADVEGGLRVAGQDPLVAEVDRVSVVQVNTAVGGAHKQPAASWVHINICNAVRTAGFERVIPP